MSIIDDKVTSFTFLHQNQPDRPNTVFPSTAAFKAALDSQAQQLQTGLNGAIDGLVSTAAGDSGAHSIGSASVPGLTGNTVYAQLNNAASQIQGLMLTPTSAFLPRQAIVNGNIDIAQRGTVFSNPNAGSYGIDRYLISYASDGGVLPTTITHEQLPLSGEIPNSSFAYRLTANGAGSGFGVNSSYGVFQRIENGTRYLCGAGQQLTISFYARSNIVGKRLGIGFSQRYGTGGSPSASENIIGAIFNLTSTFQRYTLTINTNTLAGKTFGTNRDDYFQVGLFHQWGTTTALNTFGAGTAESFVGSGVVDITQIMVNAGGTPLPFQPQSLQDELRRCQRYYEKSYPYTTPPGNATLSGALFHFTEDGLAAGATYNYVSYRVPKRIPNPTVIIYGTGGTINTVNDETADRVLGAGNLGVANSEWGFQQTYTLVASTSRRRRFHFTSDAEL